MFQDFKNIRLKKLSSYYFVYFYISTAISRQNIALLSWTLRRTAKTMV